MEELEELIEYINTLELVVSQEMSDRHDIEKATFKKKYSNRANLDSEYLEDDVSEYVKDVEAIKCVPYGSKHPWNCKTTLCQMLADIRYSGMIIDFKEIASIYHNLQHDYMRYIEALAAGKLTHFLYFKSNRLRYENNKPDTIPVGYKLQFEFLGIYDVNTVMSQIIRGGNHGKVNVCNLRENYGR